MKPPKSNKTYELGMQRLRLMIELQRLDKISVSRDQEKIAKLREQIKQIEKDPDYKAAEPYGA
jgi:hypothetical protein